MGRIVARYVHVQDFDTAESWDRGVLPPTNNYVIEESEIGMAVNKRSIMRFFDSLAIDSNFLEV